MKIKMVILVLAAGVAGIGLMADTLTWSGGDGTWDATSLNWNNGASAWTAGSTAVFSGAGGAVTVSGQQNVGALTFDTSGYTLSGDMITNSATGTPGYFDITVAEGHSATINTPLRADNAILRKYGRGTLQIGGENYFHPAKDSGVYEGILKLTKGETRSLGKKDFNIMAGATLDLNGCCNGTATITLPVIHPRGTGFNGMGAVANTGAAHANRAFGNLNLNADAMVCGPSRIDISSVNLLGYSLSVSNIGQLAVSKLMRRGTNPQTLTIWTNAMFTSFNANAMGTDTSVGKTILMPGSKLNLWNSQSPGHTIDVHGPAVMQAHNNNQNCLGKLTGTLTFDGEVSLNGGAKTNIASTIELAGTLKGSGTIRLTEGHLRISATNNTWSGGIVVDGYKTYRYLQIGQLRGTKGTLGNVESIYGTSDSSTYVYVRSDESTLSNCHVTNGCFRVFDGGTYAFDGCYMTNVQFMGTKGGFTFRNTKVESPVRNLLVGTRLARDELDTGALTNVNCAVDIEEGCDLTFNVVEGCNGSKITLEDGSEILMTGIVNQRGGMLRTLGRADPDNGGFGIRTGHYPQSVTTYNLSGGTISIGNGCGFAVAVDGTGTVHQTGGEIFCEKFDLNARTGMTGDGTYIMEGGELNVGSAGVIVGNGKATPPYSCSLRGGTIRATADTIFKVDATLNSTSGLNNVTFDTAGHSLSVSNVLSGTGGLAKAGAGTMTIAKTATYTGSTRLLGGTLAFAGAYPGGEIEIDAATQDGVSAPLLTARPFAFASGKAKVRVTGAELLDQKTYGPMRTVVESTVAISEAPALELVASDGTVLPDEGKWRLVLADGGRKLKFGAMRGTQILLK